MGPFVESVCTVGLKEACLLVRTRKGAILQESQEHKTYE
jgi:hypothetical protein